jgi:hypothetical protein
MHYFMRHQYSLLTKVRTAATAVGFAAAFSATAVAQKGDTTASRVLAPGVTYRQVMDKRGPWTMYIVRVDLRRAGIDVRPARAHDALKGRERTTEMVKRVDATGDKVLAAVNGDFFELKAGENENDQVIGGEWWKGLKVTDSPYDTYDNVHIQLALDARKHPSMGRYELDATAWDHGTPTPIITLNFNPVGKPEGTALYTPRFGATTPVDTTRLTAEAPLVSAGHRGDTLLYVRAGAVSKSSGSAIPAGGAVLAAYGAGLRNTEVLAMAEGDTVKVLLTTMPKLARGAAPTTLIGGWPRILRDGTDVAGEAASVEGTISRNAEMRHPRTAVGFSHDSTTLIIMAVDGRSENSGGMTLHELAKTMRSLGAWQAMNFDGGGSTTMVIDGAVVNKPTDTTGEREVGNALLVVRKK